MTTPQQFLWLIHYGLLALYGWEIAKFVYGRVRQPSAFKQSTQSGALQVQWNSIGGAGLGLVFIHCLFYGGAVGAVPVLLIIYGGAAIYSGIQNEAAKPFLRKIGNSGTPNWLLVLRDKAIAFACTVGVFVGAVFLFQKSGLPLEAATFAAILSGLLVDYLLRKRRERAAKPKPSQEQQGSAEEDDPDFSFKQDRWERASSWNEAGSTAGYNAEADYQNALTEAQAWADQASNSDTAAGYARRFEELGKNPALHPKDKLRYNLAAMLLRERLKGQGKASPAGSGRDPTDADLSRLGLPVPPRS
jgi:hypothetical protein